MAFSISRLFSLFSLQSLWSFYVAFGWPSQYSCNIQCMKGLSPGGHFGYMGIAKFGTGPTGTHCKITTNIPTSGYVLGSAYTVKVTSVKALGRKVVTNAAGQFSGSDSSNLGMSVTTSNHMWVAKGSIDAEFHALCGAGGATDEMWVAEPVVVRSAAGSSGGVASSTPAATVVSTTAGLGASTTSSVPMAMASTSSQSGVMIPSTSSSSSTSSSRLGVVIPRLPSTTPLNNYLGRGGMDTVLMAGVSGRISMRSRMSDRETIEFEVTSDRNTWVGLGFSDGRVVSMTGANKGADIFACENGELRRYWVTAKLQPSSPDPAIGSCEYFNGMTTMKFQRKLNAMNAHERAIVPGISQQVIYAHGTDGVPTWTYHGGARGGKMIDFLNMRIEDTDKKPGEAALYLHFIFMTVAFGAVLPWGVALAIGIRRMNNAPPGAWFTLHKRFQIIGWVLQIIGFFMAAWHVTESEMEHFDHPHKVIGLVVVLLATLQPLNAAIRNNFGHPKAGVPKTQGRVMWEYFHKGSGYMVLFLGIINICYGAWYVSDMGYDDAVIGVASFFILFSILPVMTYCLICLVNRNNGCSRRLASLPTPRDDEEFDQSIDFGSSQFGGPDAETCGKEEEDPDGVMPEPGKGGRGRKGKKGGPGGKCCGLI